MKEELGRREVHTLASPLVGKLLGKTCEADKDCYKKVLGRCHVSLQALETVVVEIDAILPLSFVLSEMGDPEPLMPAHLLHR